jgi:hypothetical protein
MMRRSGELVCISLRITLVTSIAAGPVYEIGPMLEPLASSRATL